MRVGQRWHGHLLAPDANLVPLPRFRTGSSRRQHMESECTAAESHGACLTTALDHTVLDDVRDVSYDSLSSENRGRGVFEKVEEESTTK